MIPLCNSLKEAIAFVKDNDVREELEYQYDHFGREIAAAKDKVEHADAILDELEELKDDLAAAQRDSDYYEERADSLEDSLAEANYTLKKIRQQIIIGGDDVLERIKDILEIDDSDSVPGF